MKKERNDTKLTDFVASKGVEALPKLSMRVRRSLTGHLFKVYALHFAEAESHAHMLVSAGQDGKLIVWDTLQGLKTHMMPLRSAWVMTCAFAPSGQFVACGGLDNNCIVYSVRDQDTATPKPYRELLAHTCFVSSCRFLNDRQLVTASGDKTCILWDVDAQTRSLEFADHGGELMSLGVSQDKNVIVTGACLPDSTCKLWDIRTGKCTQTFYGHTADVNSVSFFPNGQLFASGGDDNTLRLWDVRADRELNCMTTTGGAQSLTSVGFSSSGRLLFAGYDDANCHVWDTLRGAKVHSMSEHRGRVSSLCVHAGGACVATGSWDSFIRCWA